jgi:MFS superfamily sulfate permease-like transporter
MAFLTTLKRHHAHNLQTFCKQPLAEIAGSLGDLGTLLPLMIALTLSHSISLPSTLVFTGLANIVTGFVFGLPLPVQPMKAIAAVAIARQFSVRENMAAGITVSTVVLAMSASGLLEWFSRVIPVPVVKGIQVGAGLSLVLSAGTSLLGPLGWISPSWSDNYLWALFAFFFLLLVTVVEKRRTKSIPYALVVFVLGLVLAGIQLVTERKHDHISDPHIWQPHVYVPEPKQFWTTILASLGQLPLTTLNSIIAVTHLSTELLPNIAEPTPTALGISVASMNLIGCWFGAMPTCHGSGGRAAQYRVGARSGASIILLGFFKLILGLFVGETIVDILRGFPKSLLAIMVVAAGVELAKVGESLNVGARDLWEESTDGRIAKELTEQERKERWSVMLITVAGLLAFRNDAVGFLAGMFWHWGLHAPEYWASRRSFFSRRTHEHESLLH